MIRKVFIVGTFSFPSGQAASARMAQLALGFSDHVDSVKVLSIFGQSETRPKSWARYEHREDISYYYITEYDFQGSSPWLRIKNRFLQFLGRNAILDELGRNLSGKEDELVFAYGRSYHFMKGLQKRKSRAGWKTKLVFDIVEPPHSQENFLSYLKHPFALDSKWVFSKKLIGSFDGCTFITESLLKRFHEISKSSLIVPSMLYPSQEGLQPVQEELAPVESKKEIHIGYLGSLIKKDNPQLLLDLGDHLNRLGFPIRIHIVGRFELFEEGRMWKSRFQKSAISESVVFYSDPTDSERDKLLATFDFLVMFRFPDQLQKDTFPTRVVELLKANKPLIINSFGDLNLYFEHGKNCIDIDPNKLPSIEDWNTITQNQVLKKIQKGGAKLLSTKFSSKVQAKSIIDWMFGERE